MSNAEGAITRAASQLPQEEGGGDEHRKRGNDSFALSDDDEDDSMGMGTAASPTSGCPPKGKPSDGWMHSTMYLYSPPERSICDASEA